MPAPEEMAAGDSAYVTGGISGQEPTPILVASIEPRGGDMGGTPAPARWQRLRRRLGGTEAARGGERVGRRVDTGRA